MCCFVWVPLWWLPGHASMSALGADRTTGTCSSRGWGCQQVVGFVLVSGLQRGRQGLPTQRRMNLLKTLTAEVPETHPYPSYPQGRNMVRVESSGIWGGQWRGWTQIVAPDT